MDSRSFEGISPGWDTGNDMVRNRVSGSVGIAAAITLVDSSWVIHDYRA
jgi:hypothetical protein